MLQVGMRGGVMMMRNVVIMLAGKNLIMAVRKERNSYRLLKCILVLTVMMR